MPVLTAGRHRSPDLGSCVMEYVSVLAGEPWSDRPGCTERALGELARQVNDDVRPEARPALGELAPRLVGAVGRDAAIEVVIAAVARVGLESAPGDKILTRIQGRAQKRIAPSTGTRARLRGRVLRFGRAFTGTGLAATYLQVGRALAGRPRAERDAVRIRALVAATEDVRRHLPGSTEGVPAERAPGPVRDRSMRVG
jgi:hypothetical protein